MGGISRDKGCSKFVSTLPETLNTSRKFARIPLIVPFIFINCKKIPYYANKIFWLSLLRSFRVTHLTAFLGRI